MLDFKVTDKTRSCKLFVGALESAKSEIKRILFQEMDESPRLELCLMRGEDVIWDESETITKLDTI